MHALQGYSDEDDSDDDVVAVKSSKEPSTAKVASNDICTICGEEARYTCPRCDARSCSVACVKEHKRTNECDGLFPRSVYLDLEQMSDNSIRADFQFLEEVSNVVDGSQRDRKVRMSHREHAALKKVDDIHTGEAQVADLESRFVRLRKAARTRDIDVVLMSKVMSRHKANSSHFHKKLGIFWHVEWIFASTPEPHLSLSDAKLSESSTWNKALDSHLENVQEGTPLAAYKDSKEKLCLFMKIFGSASDKPRYYEIKPTDTIHDSLSGKRVLEYPTILVVLPDQAAPYRASLGALKRTLEAMSSSEDEDADESESSDDDDTVLSTTVEEEVGHDNKGSSNG